MSKVLKEGSSQEIVHGTGRSMTVIISAIAVVLGIACIVLAVLMIKKHKKNKTSVPGAGARYSNVMTPNVEYSGWEETEIAGASGRRLKEEPEEDERGWCAE